MRKKRDDRLEAEGHPVADSELKRPEIFAKKDFETVLKKVTRKVQK